MNLIWYNRKSFFLKLYGKDNFFFAFFLYMTFTLDSLLGGAKLLLMLSLVHGPLCGSDYTYLCEDYTTSIQTIYVS